jgi:prepilin-type N-terminal cleavage/methylation domain-containing protein
MPVKEIKNKSGFTLTEVIITVIIVGVLASLALPRFTGVFERVRASEGVQILTSLLGAQKAYKLENGSYSDDPALLDIEIDRAQNFDITTIAVDDDATNVAEIQRNNGGYTLSIDEDGVIGCAPGAITCAQAGH